MTKNDCSCGKKMLEESQTFCYQWTFSANFHDVGLITFTYKLPYCSSLTRKAPLDDNKLSLFT